MRERFRTVWTSKVALVPHNAFDCVAGFTYYIYKVHATSESA
jgi:hypothetical protein